MAVLRSGEAAENFIMSADEITAETYSHSEVILKVEAMITKVRVDHGATVRCVTMDSDGAHIAARRVLAAKHPHIIFLPCYAQQINLIIKRF